MPRWSVEVIDRNSQAVRSVSVRAPTANEAQLKVAATDAGIVGSATLVDMEDDHRGDEHALSVNKHGDQPKVGHRVGGPLRPYAASEFRLARTLTILLVAFAVGLLVLGNVANAADFPGWGWLTIGGLICWLLSKIPAAMLLFKCWNQIQDGYQVTTPTKAVALCFVPFFNLYWIFVAYCGLSSCVQRYCHRHESRSVQLPSKELAWIWASLHVVLVLAAVLALFIPVDTYVGQKVTPSGLEPRPLLVQPTVVLVLAVGWIVAQLLYVYVVHHMARAAIGIAASASRETVSAR